MTPCKIILKGEVACGNPSDSSQVCTYCRQRRRNEIKSQAIRKIRAERAANGGAPLGESVHIEKVR